MLKQMRLAWCKGLLALMLFVGSAAEAQDVFFTQSGGRGLQNAKTNARLSKAETDIGVIQDDLKTIRPFARREIPSCDSTGAKLLWRGDNWSCDDEIDPTVQPFAKKELPTCGAGQILSASGSEFSCANSGFLSAETDPTVQPFAKQPLPACGTGTVLSVGTAGELKCVADNAGLTAETDPYVHDFARTDKATITNCGFKEVLKMVGFRLTCVEDKGIEFETDPNVQAFARNDIAGASLAACGSDQVVVAESSGANVVLACKDGATALGGVLSAQTLAGLADTTIAAPASNQILRFNGTAWVNSSDKIGTTTDNRWCYFTAGNITCDRNIPAPMPAAACASTEIITWDGTAWGCQNIASAIGGNLTLGSLSDVTITAPIAGQGLTFDGTGWVNGYNTRIAQGNSDVRVVDTGTGAIQLVPDGVATLTALQGQVGINNNTPNAALDVIGLISGSNISTAGWVNAGLVQASGYVSASQLHTSGTVYGGELRSTSDTRVGQDLYVVGNLYVSGTQQFDGVTFANGGVSATGTVTATSFAGDGSLLTGVIAVSVDKVISGTTRILANEDGAISFTTAGAERMVLRENGRLGLGTSNPQTELEVNGSISATNLFLSGNLYVSGSQNIDGVIFANGGVSATGAVTATSFAGDGSLITGVTADNMPWHRLTSVPNPIRFISDSTLTAAEVDQLQNINTSILPASVWGNLAYLNQSVSTTSAPTFDGLTLTGNMGGTNAILSGYLTVPSATITNATIDNDLRVRGNLYVSGSQNIEGVLFADGGIQATGTVTATTVTATAINAYYASFTTLTAGNLSGNVNWYDLQNIPNQVQLVSDSGNINLANLGVTGTVTASTVSATTLNSRYLSSTEGWIGALTAPVASVGALNVTSGTLTHLTAHGGNLNNMAGISVSGIVSATFFEGDGSRLSNVVATSITLGINQLTDGHRNATTNNLFVGHKGGGVGATDLRNIGVGANALTGLNNSGGVDNIAIGHNALVASGAANMDYNVAIGTEALQHATTQYNTAIGYRAGWHTASATTADWFTAVGAHAGDRNTGDNVSAMGLNSARENTGSSVSAMGWNSAFQNTGTGVSAMGVGSAQQNTGSSVSAMGVNSALQNTGSSVSAMGVGSAQQNTGSSVSAMGFQSAYQNTGANGTFMGRDTGYQNTSANVSSFGYHALRYRDASNTTAIGYEAGRGADTTRAGFNNAVLLGYRAGYSNTTGADQNTLLGYQAGWGITSGASNTVVGNFSTTGGLTTGSGNILIGADVRPANATGNNQLNIGNTIFGTGLGSGATIPTGSRVGIGTNNPNARLDVAGLISSTGVSVTGIVSATYFEGDGSRLTNVVADSADAVDWPNITNKPASIVSLSTLAAAAANNFIMADGTDWTVVNAAAARTGLGLGTMATQNANAVGISGGSITGLTSLSVAGIVTATYFEGDGSRLTGITADSADSILWDNILAIPAQVQLVSDSGNINLANLGVTGTVTASTVSTTTLNSRYLSSTEGWIGALTAPVASLGALNVTSGTLTHLTAHGGNLNNMAGISVSGIVSATFFEGDGSRLTNINASEIVGLEQDRIVSGTTNITAYNDASLTFTTANQQRMVIDERGFVGVGVSVPLATWHVEGPALVTSNTEVSGTIKLSGTGDETCSGAQKFTIRANPTTGAMEVCLPGS